MNSIHTNHHASSFFDKKYHHRRRSIIRRLSASVADDDHDEGVKNTHKKGAVLFLSFVPLSPETSAAGVRTRDLMEGFIKAGFSGVRFKNGRARKQGGEQTVGGERGKILRERDTESRGCV